MARVTTSKTKLSRRIGRNLFLKGARSFSAKDDFTKHPYKPGEHGNGKRFARLSEYGKQLQEKQSIKLTYGLLERQMANLFKKAFKKTGDTGKIALGLLERRLDNVVYKGGLANSRSQARQLVTHGHFLVNGQKVNIPSYELKIGDVISVKEGKLKSAFWQNYKLEVPDGVPSWIDNTKKHQLKVINLPLDEDLPQDFKIAAVVEWYSRKVA
jgi:small subunit ribosomal protein S4